MSTPSGYTLHQLSGYLSLAGLALCFGSFIAVIFSAMTRRIGTHTGHLKHTVSSSTVMRARLETHAPQSLVAKLTSRLNTIRTRTRGSSKVASVWFALLCVAVGGYGVSRLPKPNVVTEHNVAVLRKLSKSDFAYISDEKPMGDIFRVCPVDQESGIDVEGMLTQAAEGQFVAERATWQELGICRSLLKPEWQFWFRDAANNFTYRRIN